MDAEDQQRPATVSISAWPPFGMPTGQNGGSGAWPRSKPTLLQNEALVTQAKFGAPLVPTTRPVRKRDLNLPAWRVGAGALEWLLRLAISPQPRRTSEQRGRAMRFGTNALVIQDHGDHSWPERRESAVVDGHACAHSHGLHDPRLQLSGAAACIQAVVPAELLQLLAAPAAQVLRIMGGRDASELSLPPTLQGARAGARVPPPLRVQ